MQRFLPDNRPALVLAPMQAVTDLPFMRVIAKRGAPDWFVTEYFRVHHESRLDRYILRSIKENETGKPIFAQMIGRDVPSLLRSAKELAQLPIAGIDLNLGCPAPIVCRKDAGGGLLRSPDQVDRLLGELRAAIPGSFTVKTRLGYDSDAEFETLLGIFQKHQLNGLTIHGRTVKERYQSPVHPDWVALAVKSMPCPVIANGNIVDVSTGLAYTQKTQAAGLMIGRGAIRNPWIFQQLQAAFLGQTPFSPTYRDLHDYILQLYHEIARESAHFNPTAHVQRMKKTLIYISHSLPEFEQEIRRVDKEDDFFRICVTHLNSDNPIVALPDIESKLFCGFSELLK